MMLPTSDDKGRDVVPAENKRYPRLPRLKVTKCGKINEPTAHYCSSVDVYSNMQKMRRLDREEFRVIHLDAKNRMVGYEIIAVGTLTAAMVHPREVFKGALLNNSAAIVCCHNHPSGDPTPSSEDDVLTEQLEKGGDLLKVRLLDHVIIGSQNFYSYADKGKL